MKRRHALERAPIGIVAMLLVACAGAQRHSEPAPAAQPALQPRVEARTPAGTPQLTLQSGHGDNVTAIAWSPDGTNVASASDDGTVRLWDADTGEVRAILKGHSAPVEMIGWSPDGETLASASSFEDTVRLWNVRAGEVRAVLEGHDYSVETVAWSPDGTTLASGSYDDTVRLWDAETGESVALLEGHESSVDVLAWSPDGEMLASGSYDDTVRLWDADTGEIRAVLDGHSDSVHTLAWTPDGATLASGAETVRLWDPQTGEQRAVLEGHAEDIWALAWSPDGATLASGSLDDTVRLWDAETGESVAVLEDENGVGLLGAWSPDGTTLASGGGDTVRLWVGETGESLAVLEGHDEAVTSVAWSPDGQMLASGSDDDTVRLWQPDASESEPEVLGGDAASVTALAWSPQQDVVVSTPTDGAVRMWDVRTAESRALLEGETPVADAVAWSPDGTMVAARVLSTITVWDAATWEPRVELELWVGTALAWSPDSTTLASGRPIRFWDADTGEVWETENQHRAPLQALAWSPDGATLASSGQDGTVRLWDGETGEAGAVFEHGIQSTDEGATFQAEGWEHKPGWDASDPFSSPPDVDAVAWSPDGRTVASSGWDWNVRLWDVQAQKSRAVLEGHSAVAGVLAWHPDATSLASGDGDGTVRLWDPSTGEARAVLEGHSEPIEALAWSRDGTMLASGSGDGTVSVWKPGREQPIRALRPRSGRVKDLAWGPEGRVVAAATSGGATALVRVADGEVVLLRAVSGQGGEPAGEAALAYTPDGLFSGAERAASRVYFRIGDDVLESPIVSASQLFYSFHAPSLMEAFWAGRSLDPPPDLRAGVGAPPEVSLGAVAEQVGSTVRVTVDAKARMGGGVQDVTLLLNGRKVPAAGPGKRDGQRLRRAFDVRPPTGESTLRGVAYSGLGRVRGDSDPVSIERAGESPPRRRLRLLSVAVDRYADPTLTLDYRKRDARAIAKRFGAQEGRAFAEVEITRLCDDERSHRDEGCDGPATRARILAELERLAREATVEDVVAVHLTGHGETHRCADEDEPRFRFLGTGVTSRHPETFCSQSVSVRELSDAFTAIPARFELLLLDACKAGASEQGAAGEQRALRNLHYFDGLPVMTAAARGAKAQEVARLESSLYTATLLEGLDRATGQDDVVSVADLATHFEQRLPELAVEHTGSRQEPVVSGGAEDFVVAR